MAAARERRVQLRQARRVGRCLRTRPERATGQRTNVNLVERRGGPAKGALQSAIRSHRLRNPRGHRGETGRDTRVEHSRFAHGDPARLLARAPVCRRSVPSPRRARGVSAGRSFRASHFLGSGCHPDRPRGALQVEAASSADFQIPLRSSPGGGGLGESGSRVPRIHGVRAHPRHPRGVRVPTALRRQ